jgi:hypothetical protein
MTDEQLMIVQGLVDRLLYLKGEERKEFLGYLNTLYEVYPIPRKILYGLDAIVNDKTDEYGT